MSRNVTCLPLSEKIVAWALPAVRNKHRASILLVPEDLLVRLEIAPRAAPGQDTPCLGRQAAKNFNAIQRIVASFHDANRLPRPTL